ncbi:signal peptidase I [Halorubrum halodurans]|uniref:Signal peptidase I n=1 Tax=Halorubrum halodurans TaxID=1383851 RepID=A0A256IT86_9EURY|nr:signal peptidase I [Halorubrum halodurans]OYR59352.1 signal peptidase I [Halorubrum halodurans]
MNSPITLKRSANLLGIVLLIAVVAPFVVYAVPAVVGAEYSFVVLTASMTPAIAPGDVVVVDERDPAAIGEGDVITFVRGDSEVPVTHRVIDVTESGGEVAFETKGDANEDPDSALVPGSNVLGAVAFSIPYIGYVIQFTDSATGFTLLVVLPFALLALSEIWSLYRSRTGGGGASTAVEADAADADAGATDAETAASTAAAATGSVETEAVETESDAADEPGFVVTNRTVEGAVGVLLAFVPYAAYTAYTLQTALAIAVAVGTGMTLLMAVVLLVTAGGDDGSADAASRSADDGDDGSNDRAPDADRGAASEDGDVGAGGDGDVGDGADRLDDRPADRGDDSSGTGDGNPMGLFERPMIAPAADGGSETVDERGETVDGAVDEAADEVGR